jgi:hypothetical protein
MLLCDTKYPKENRFLMTANHKLSMDQLTRGLNHIRNIKLASILLLIGWLPYGVLMGYWIGESNGLMLTAVLIYWAALIGIGIWERNVACPQCQQKFHSRPSRRFPVFNYSNCFSWHCLNCGVRVPFWKK